jgi:hypothetical protein
LWGVVERQKGEEKRKVLKTESDVTLDFGVFYNDMDTTR